MKNQNGLSVATILATGLCFMLMAGGPALAGNDASIKGMLRNNIQTSMGAYIQANTINGAYHIYDAVTGELLKLKLEKLHSGIVKKGNFYVSCADFTDMKGRMLDLDFLVMPDGNELKTTQAVIHAVDGKKRKYHLED